MVWEDVPDPESHKGRSSEPKDSPGGDNLKAKIIDEVGIRCPYELDLCFKVFQVIQYHDGGEYAFRTGYYVWQPKKKIWGWGQYSQIIYPDEWERLYRLAEEKGFFEKYKNKERPDS